MLVLHVDDSSCDVADAADENNDRGVPSLSEAVECTLVASDVRCLSGSSSALLFATSPAVATPLTARAAEALSQPPKSEYSVKPEYEYLANE